jgi:hypothetical protein
LLWPLSKTTRVTTNPDPLGHTRRRSVQDEHLVPARRSNLRIRGSLNRTRASTAREGREERSLTHAVTVGARYGAEQRNGGYGACVGDGDCGAVGERLAVCEGERGAGSVGQKVWGRKGFYTEFFRVSVGISLEADTL